MFFKRLDDYKDKFKHVKISRDENGILEAVFHTDGSDLVWGIRAHDELTEFWDCVGRDRDNKVVIITGSGETFISKMVEGNPGWLTPDSMQTLNVQGPRMPFNHLQVQVPIIAVVNGPVTAHAEMALLSDVVLAAPHVYFADYPHLPSGLVPGDGIQTMWMTLFGLNRGRYSLYTGCPISAEEALAAGAIAEIHESDVIMDRAREIALYLASLPQVAVRATRRLLTEELTRKMWTATAHGGVQEGFAAWDYWPTEFKTHFNPPPLKFPSRTRAKKG